MKKLTIILATIALCALPVVAQLPANAAPLTNAGAPSNGTSEVQTLTIGGAPSGGTFKLTFQGETSKAITWSSTNATLISNIQAALNAMASLKDGDVTVAAGSLTAGVGTVTMTFTANRAKMAVSTMTAASSLTGTSPTLAIAKTTTGVTATGRGAATGRLLIDTSAGKLYINTGAAQNPTWTVVGSQT